MRKSCVVYDSWADQILNLPDDMAGELAKMVLQYAIYGEEFKTENPALKAMFIPIRKRLDEDEAAWEEVKKQRSEAGKKGMARRWHNGDITNDNTVISDDNKEKQGITPITVNVNDNVNVLKKKNNKKKKGTFHNFPEREYDYSELKAGVDHV